MLLIIIWYFFIIIFGLGIGLNLRNWPQPQPRSCGLGLGLEVLASFNITGTMVLRGGERFSTICLAVLPQYWSVSGERRMDGQTDYTITISRTA